MGIDRKLDTRVRELIVLMYLRSGLPTQTCFGGYAGDRNVGDIRRCYGAIPVGHGADLCGTRGLDLHRDRVGRTGSKRVRERERSVAGHGQTSIAVLEG
jgi:hypothetical protein